MTSRIDERDVARAELQAEKAEVFRLQASHSLLYAEVEALRKDAERYRWLGKSDWYVGPGYFFCDEAGGMQGYSNQNASKTDLDATIDAMLSAQAGERT